jgi:hypothetical protein
MRIVGAEHRISKTVRVEKENSEDLAVLTRSGLTVNVDIMVSVI